MVWRESIPKTNATITYIRTIYEYKWNTKKKKKTQIYIFERILGFVVFCRKTIFV